MKKTWTLRNESINFFSLQILRKKSFWVGAILPFLLTLGIYKGFLYIEHHESEERFEKQGKTVISTFSEKLERYEDILFSIQSFYAASPSLNQQEWTNFISSILSHNHVFSAISNIAYVENQKDFNCRQVYLNSTTSFSGNLCTNPKIKEILSDSHDWKLPIVGNLTAQTLTFALPLYSRGPTPTTQKEMDARRAGWIIVNLDMLKFVETFFPEQKKVLSIELATQEKAASIYGTKQISTEENFSLTKQLIFDKNYLNITYNGLLQDYDIDATHFIGYLILAVGVFLSLISGLLVWSFLSTKERALLIAEEMNKHIKDRESRIRHLLDTTPGAIYSCTPDEDRRVTFLSDFIENITGYTASHFIGHSTSDFTRLIHPDDRKFRIDAILENLEKHKKFTCEYRLIDKNNMEKWLLEQGHLVYDENNNPYQIVGAIFDITSRKIAENEAKKLSLALENAAECIAFLDRRLMFKDVNPAFAELTGWTQEAMIGLALPIIVHPKDLEKLQALYKASLHQMKMTKEICGVKADGSSFYMSLTFIPSFDTHQKLVGTYCFVRDISQRKKVEEELRKAKDEALEASRSKSEFLAMMSHELRTPLNAIIGYSDLLAEQAKEEGTLEKEADLIRINEAGQHLLSLINDILDVSKLEAGKTEIYKEVFAVDDIVLNVNGMAKPLMKMNNNDYVCDVEKDLGLMNSDFVKIRQNLLNLISNAAKFTDKGNIHLKVNLHHKDDGDWVVFLVKDTGCGITPQQIEKLFNPFVQADNSTTRKYGGTGLGLTLVRRYTEMLGGEITVESTPGEGTTFIMSLPRGDVEDVTNMNAVS